MDQRLDQSLKQTFHFLLSPKMLATLEMLSLPYLEMIEKIEQAAGENPVIEIEKPDRLVEYLRYLETDKKASKELDGKEYAGLQNIKAGAETLPQHLKEQLKLEDLEKERAEIVEELIDNLDERGYLKNYPELSQEIEKKFTVSSKIVEQALKILQTFEPEGVGARDLKECLRIQIREHNFESFELEEILEQAVTRCLEDLAEQKYALAAQKLEIDEEAVEELAQYIKKNLNPNPGASFGGEERQVIPSFAIETNPLKKCYNIVNLEERYGPKITISKTYEKMLKDPATDEKTVKFLKNQFDNAREFMEDLLKRKQTSEQIMELILENQKEFLDKGVKYFRPLEQKMIADQLGLHPSTISRAIADKYVQTPRGLFPIKYLCPREFGSSTALQIKAKLRELVKLEDVRKPFSDDELAVGIGQLGIKITRRTVAAYRQDLEIPRSEERKKK